MKVIKVGFVGVGKLGQSCAEMMAEKHHVKGFDISKRNPKNFEMVNSLDKLVSHAEIIFVAVETPHDPLYDGKAPTSHLPYKDFSYETVKSVLTDIGVLATSSKMVVLISTVLPGTVRRELAKLVGSAKFVYNPYLIAMGTVKWDMVNPEMLMIGTEDGNKTGDAKWLLDFYHGIIENEPLKVIGTWEEIEALKVFYNTFISAKVSLVNMIQDVAMRLGHMNSEVVCDALAKCDRRIMGPSYMKPGMGDGGACHPRDNIALRFLAEKLDLGYDLFDAVMHSREQQAKNMAEFMVKRSNGRPIIIVGKAYKPLVPYEAGSSSMLVGHYVSEMNGDLYYYDELLNEIPPIEIVEKPAIFLLAHNPQITYGEQLEVVPGFYSSHEPSSADSALTLKTANGMELKFSPGSLVVDPWRKLPFDFKDDIEVIHYGNSRIENGLKN